MARALQKSAFAWSCGRKCRDRGHLALVRGRDALDPRDARPAPGDRMPRHKRRTTTFECSWRGGWTACAMFAPGFGSSGWPPETREMRGPWAKACRSCASTTDRASDEVGPCDIRTAHPTRHRRGIDVGLTHSKDGEHPEGGGKHAPARRVARSGYPSTPLFVLRRLPGLGQDQRLNQREQFRDPFPRRRPRDVQVDHVVSVSDAVAYSDYSAHGIAGYRSRNCTETRSAASPAISSLHMTESCNWTFRMKSSRCTPSTQERTSRADAARHSRPARARAARRRPRSALLFPGPAG